jgi:transcriptional regulator with XRE-family HTH domain
MDVLQAHLKEFREMRRLTQAELGERAGIASAAISHFETGQRVPSLESIIKLADSLEVTIDSLLGRGVAANASEMDPIFLRATKASSKTLDTIRRVTAALLAESESAR